MSVFPQAALENHSAFLGKTGSGKTYACKGIVEDLLRSGQRVCIIDPTGAWHGLRSSSTGKRAGFPVTIFGGLHGDLPLDQGHGEALAEILGTSNTPAILDTSQMRTGERTQFFTDFAEALLRKNKHPLHLFIDEAHRFAPQGRVQDPRSGAMLAAANELVSAGRSRGLRVTLISQRPAKLHKDSLTQVETMVAMRLVAPQDRDAVWEWIKDNADQAKGREIMESLATLKGGEGWIWSPALGVLERVKFPKISTLDSSSTPTDEEEGQAVVAAVDREAIASRLQTVKADALANDPVTLRREIAELRRELKAKPAGPAPEEVKADAERAFALGIANERADVARLLKVAHDGLRGRLEIAGRILDEVLNPLHDVLERLDPEAYTKASETTKALRDIRVDLGNAALKAGAKAPPRSPTSGVRPATDRRAASSNGSAEALAKGEQVVLRALIQYPEGLRREQIGVLTGYKRSTRNAYIDRLRTAGHLELDGETVRATAGGRGALPDAEPLPTGAALREFWRGRLSVGERAILDSLISAYPEAVSREALDDATGYKRSTRNAYIDRLRAKELLDEPARGEVRARSTLFED